MSKLIATIVATLAFLFGGTATLAPAAQAVEKSGCKPGEACEVAGACEPDSEACEARAPMPASTCHTDETVNDYRVMISYLKARLAVAEPKADRPSALPTDARPRSPVSAPRSAPCADPASPITHHPSRGIIMQTTIENTTTEAPPTIPPVECAPWCLDGSGHADATHPDDQFCISEDSRVMLTAEKLVEYDKGVWGLGAVEVYAMREAYSIRPLVKIVHNEDGRDGTISLTVAEARELMSALSAIVEAVEGS